MNYQELIEKLMTHYTSVEFKTEVDQARKEFFDWAGVFDENSEDFEIKTSQFMDWYTLGRKMTKTGLTPVEMALEGRGIKPTEEEVVMLNHFKNHRHSLFEFLKIKGKDLYVKDVFSGNKYVLKDSVLTEGFNKGELFEARLLPADNNFQFSGAFCMHPPEVSKFILKEIKKISKLPKDQQDDAREELIHRIFKMKYKHEQYRHVDVREIYSNESRLRL